MAFAPPRIRRNANTEGEQCFEDCFFVGILRTSLNQSTETHRGIQSRIANTLTPDGEGTFAGALDQQLTCCAAGNNEVNLPRDLNAFADNQLCDYAVPTLLSKTYAQ